MAPPSYRLYTTPGSLFAFAPLVVAEYVGVSVAIEPLEDDEDTIGGVLASKSPTGKAPVLETKRGETIASSLAIARFLARLRLDSDLSGRTGSLRDAVAVEDWTNWATQELELPACTSCYMATKILPLDVMGFAKAKTDLARALRVLETHLRDAPTTYLVLPDEVSLADIVVACYLVYPFTLVLEEADLVNFPTVTRWFRNCTQQPEFIAVLGKIECGKRKC